MYQKLSKVHTYSFMNSVEILMASSDGPAEQKPGSIDLLAFLDVHVNAIEC